MFGTMAILGQRKQKRTEIIGDITSRDYLKKLKPFEDFNLENEAYVYKSKFSKGFCDACKYHEKIQKNYEKKQKLHGKRLTYDLASLLSEDEEIKDRGFLKDIGEAFELFEDLGHLVEDIVKARKGNYNKPSAYSNIEANNKILRYIRKDKFFDAKFIVNAVRMDYILEYKKIIEKEVK